MDKDDQSTQIQNPDRIPVADTVESGSSVKDSSQTLDDVGDQSEQLKGMVRQLSTMLKQEEDGTEPLDTKLSQGIIDKCDRAAVKNQKKLEQQTIQIKGEQMQEARQEGFLDLFQMISSPRADLAEEQYEFGQNGHLDDEGDTLGASSSSGTSPNPDELEEKAYHQNGNMNGTDFVNGHQSFQPISDSIQDFEFEGMFDNIDDMEIDFKEVILAESQKIEAIKDVAKKLQQLRRDFKQNENKLETVRQATRQAKDKIKEKTHKIKEKVKEKAGKIINKQNLEKSKQRFKQKKLELLNQLNVRVGEARTYSQTENFMRTMDKLSFILGVALFGSFAYVLGSMPNDGIYMYYSLLVPVMVGIRYVKYKPNKWHYFLLDFCYFGGATVLVFVTFFPKSEIMYRLAFLYANGALGVATAAFSNALIFHQFDRLICLATHPVPLVVMWNVKQVTMERQKDLPNEESKFCKHPKDETWFDAFKMNILLPYAWYFVWAVLYYIFNFVIKREKIRKQKYATLYRKFQGIKWSSKILRKAGPKYSPLVFMLFHCAFFTTSHMIALMAYYSKFLHTTFMFIWLFSCVWNGSSYYVKYFEYTKKLSAQSMLVNQQQAQLKQAVNQQSEVSTANSSGKREQEKSDQKQEQNQIPEDSQLKPSASETCLGSLDESKKEK